MNEVQRHAAVHHEHIVPYYDSGDDRGQLYYAMRLMPLTLANRSGPMDPMEAVGLLIEITEAVHFLHTQPVPIVHRDLKPGNILLDDRGRAYVSDFGVAMLLDDGSSLDGARGTIPYIAPEQFAARFGEIGPACDIYSLGVILYELLTGQLPFPQTRESIILTLEREPTGPSRLRSAIPSELERICRKCLRKATRERYKSADELLDDLRCFERGEPSPIPPDGLLSRLAHWSKRPALASRLAVIIVSSCIIWVCVQITGYAKWRQNHPGPRSDDQVDPESIRID